MDSLSLGLALWFALALAGGVLLGCFLRKTGCLGEPASRHAPVRLAEQWQTSYGPDDERRSETQRLALPLSPDGR